MVFLKMEICSSSRDWLAHLYHPNSSRDFIRKFISEFSVFSAIIRRFFRSVLDGKLNRVW